MNRCGCHGWIRGARGGRRGTCRHAGLVNRRNHRAVHGVRARPRRHGEAADILIIFEGSQVWKRAVGHPAFNAAGGLDLDEALHPAGDFDRFAALELGLHIEAVQRVVDPDAILIRQAFHRGRICGRAHGDGAKPNEQEQTFRHASHFASLNPLSNFGWAYDCVG